MTLKVVIYTNQKSFALGDCKRQIFQMGDIVCEIWFCYCNIAKAFTKAADLPAQTMV